MHGVPQRHLLRNKVNLFKEKEMTKPNLYFISVMATSERSLAPGLYNLYVSL